MEAQRTKDQVDDKTLVDSLSAGRQRGVAYPTMSIEEAISTIQQLKSKLGNGPYSRVDIAMALGHACLSGPASSKISTCAQFGLLERAGSAYSLSRLAFKILSPVNDFESAEAIAEAVKMPNVYARLIKQYEGQALPQLLNNILSRDYCISEKNTDRAVMNFKKSLEYAGILKNGIVMSGSKEGENDSGVVEDTCLSKEVQKNDKARRERGESLTIDILDTGIKVIFPIKYAFELATGAFKDSLNKLKEEVMMEERTNDE